MKKSIVIIIIALLSIPVWTAQAQKRKERKALFGSTYNYEVETVQVGSDGTKLIKVWGYAKKADQAVVQAKKNAVAACLFRGLPGTATANATPAICRDPNAEMDNLDYFEKFFAPGGRYLQFINVTTDGMPSGQDRLKIKKGYKVAVYVQVMYDNLRRQMEADGIARGLNSGF